MKNIRQPAVAGMFYPGRPDELMEQIRILMESVDKNNINAGALPGISAIIAPHAGYIYSGQTAAHAYYLLAGKEYSTVVVISPSHREYFPGVCIYEGSAYRTPLGDIEVDTRLRDKMVSDKEGHIFAGTSGHGAEHALEVQLPFLQMVLKDFSILPIVVGDQHKSFIYELADKLAMHTGEETLIVASSDLSHFHTKQKAFMLDSIVENRIKEMDYDGLMKDLELHRSEACGGGPIAAAMRASRLKGKNSVLILDRSDSGDVTGDNSEVVGYLSAVIYS